MLHVLHIETLGFACKERERTAKLPPRVDPTRYCWRLLMIDRHFDPMVTELKLLAPLPLVKPNTFSRNDYFTMTISTKKSFAAFLFANLIAATVFSPNALHAQSSSKGSSTKMSNTLSSQLEEKASQSRTRMPAPMLETFKKGIESVRATGIEKNAKQVGDAAIDAQLVGWDGKTVTLSEVWKKGPVVLMWYRGGWCPYCSIQLRAMQKSMDQLKGAGATLVVLTPELPEKAKATAEANDLSMVALHDKDSVVAKQYGLVFQLPASIVPAYRDRIKLPEFNGNDDMELPLAATYVINQEGKIAYAFLDADYKKRAEPAEVVEAVKQAVAK